MQVYPPQKWGGGRFVIQIDYYARIMVVCFFLPKEGKSSMYVKCLGYQRKSGVLDNGKPYDNFYLHVVGQNKKVVGDATEILKVKPELIASVPGAPDSLLRKTLYMDKDLSGEFDTLEIAQEEK